MRVYPQLKRKDRRLGASEVADIDIFTVIKVEGFCQLPAALVRSLVALKEEGAPQNPIALIPFEEHTGLQRKLRHIESPLGRHC